jgi:hypothetical protein
MHFNSKWYLLCDLENGIALDLLQVPEVWRNITGMASLSDAELADLSWSPNADRAFLSPADAIDVGIDPDSIDTIVAQGISSVTEWVRSMRALLLDASDVVTSSDRWAMYNAIDRQYITAYRQALRDVTLQDPFAVVWPPIPPQLNFVRGVDVTSIHRPSDSFMAALTEPFPEPTLSQKQDDQWLLIHDERERRKAGGVKLNVNGTDYWFWTDEPTRTQYALLDSAARRNALPSNYVLDNWKTMSGTYVPFPVSLLYSVMDAGISQEKSLFSIAEAHRQAMLAAADPTLYDYTTGWPQTYAEFAAIP